MIMEDGKVITDEGHKGFHGEVDRTTRRNQLIGLFLPGLLLSSVPHIGQTFPGWGTLKILWHPGQ
jgi:hypothetical protein